MCVWRVICARVCVCNAYQLPLTIDTIKCVCVWGCACVCVTCKCESVILKQGRNLFACLHVRRKQIESTVHYKQVCEVNLHICPHACSNQVWKLPSVCVCVCVCVCANVTEWVCAYNFILLSQPLVKEPFRAQVEFPLRLLTLLSSSLPLWLPPSFLPLCLIISVSSSARPLSSSSDASLSLSLLLLSCIWFLHYTVFFF